MELQEFIDETLRQILAGVKKAQESPDGESINADMQNLDFGGAIANGNPYGVATRVDFDVSVSAETSGGGSGKLVVWGVGAEANAKHTASSASRISFSIPVRLPFGDSTYAEGVRAEAARKAEESQRVLQERARKLHLR